MPTQPSGLSPKTQFQNRIYQRTDAIGDAIDAILDAADETLDAEEIRTQAVAIQREAKQIAQLAIAYWKGDMS